MARREHVRPYERAETDDANLALLEIIESRRNVGEQVTAEGIDATMIHGDGADAAIDWW
jgi:hypothetical protein